MLPQHDRSRAQTRSRWARSQKPWSPSNSPPPKTYIRAGLITVSCSLGEKICWPGKSGKKNETGDEDSECFPKEIAKIVKHHNFGDEIYISRGNRGRRIRIWWFRDDPGPRLGVFNHVHYFQVRIHPRSNILSLGTNVPASIKSIDHDTAIVGYYSIGSLKWNSAKICTYIT